MPPKEQQVDKKTFYIALGIVGGTALAVLSGQLNLIFKSAFWVVLGIGIIYLLMKMWKSFDKKKKDADWKYDEEEIKEIIKKNYPDLKGKEEVKRKW